jgi:hypothetical protein
LEQWLALCLEGLGVEFTRNRLSWSPGHPAGACNMKSRETDGDRNKDKETDTGGDRNRDKETETEK